jgi:DNA modification methylase
MANNIKLQWNGKRILPEITPQPLETLEKFKPYPINDQSKLDNWVDGQTGPKNYPLHWYNRLILGDNLHILSSLEKDGFAGRVDLIYIDPPFATGNDFLYSIKLGKKKKKVKLAYQDSWGKDLSVYLQLMYDRLVLMHRILSESGLIYIHLDYHVAPYVKVILDEIFGVEQYRNEIIWCYGGGGIPKSDFPRKHDTIFRYSKTDNYTYNVEYRPYKETTTKVGGGRHSLTSGGGKLRKEGTPINDWWTDIKRVTSYKAEWVPFPTQKPVDLLERIIRTSTNEGDLVCDFFGGSGTTAIAAEKLGRRWILSDISSYSLLTAKKRLFGLSNPNNKESHALRPFQFQTIKWALDSKPAIKPLLNLNEVTYDYHVVDNILHIEIANFVIKNSELLEEVAETDHVHFSDYIDYIAIDFEYNGKFFNNMWRSYRNQRKNIETKIVYHYPNVGKKIVLLKIIDIFGNWLSEKIEINLK